MNQIAKLNTLREYLNQRIDLYEEAVDAGMMRMSLPFVRYIDARQAIFKEWLQPIDKDNLHTTLMDLWQRIFEREMVPSGGFGSIIKKSGVEKISGFRDRVLVYFCRYGTRSTKIHLRSRPENMCACISMVCLMILSIWKS